MNDPRITELQTLLPRAMLRDWVRLGSRLVRLLRDHRHPAQHGAVLDRLLDQARASVQRREERGRRVPAVHYPPELPISGRKDDILKAIREHQVVVIAGETGSGKTTQIPKICLEAGLGVEAMIGCTQPRRIAAMSVSRRIAEEMNVEWGREVGCKIRFDDWSSPETCIKLMTDGILLAEIQGDPLLSDYNAVILDEAHERSLNIDFLLGYFQGLLKKRPDLKLLVTSATIDTQAFAAAYRAPVIEVSGRMYPVEVIYSPIAENEEDAGDTTYVDAAARASERCLYEPGSGDVLVFMPGERDIKEVCDQLKARVGDAAEIIPLFGRLSAADQQRVFAPGSRPKVIVATNIAETSLTIPGIRYVVDTGLARISRYAARARTRRLPIEPISQSSANQRKGRSGRVQNGVCIRLYPESDFADRPVYSQPEIQRANLAEVILRMMAFGLGEIETFPFLNPPAPAAIQAGYALLQELGALTPERALTSLGQQLARLPIDPTLGRMLLQAQREHVTHELLIIAAGLSIQDPRERPLDQKETAQAAHRRFDDPKSDFLTLLNVWNAVHDEWETLKTQNQRRKFCKAHFLSYVRMREWQDLYAQLHEALEELGSVKLNESAPDYAAIHRAILSGLLGHIAQRQERNQYKTATGRQAMLFPGSILFERGEKQKPNASRASSAKRPRPVSVAQPEWIVAGEMVETSQLFARTAAGIEAGWVLDLAPHLCRTTYQNPHWDLKAGQVLAEERVTFNALELRRRNVAYSQVNRAEATRIFIRSALVEERLVPETADDDSMPHSQAQLLAAARAESRRPPARYAFLEQNRQLRHKLEIWQTRMRRQNVVDLDQALFDFYAQRIWEASSIHELNRLLGEKSPNYLCAEEKDLVDLAGEPFDQRAFPNDVQLHGQKVSLSYAYKPGEEDDGVTLRLPAALVRDVAPAQVEWAVPGLRESQIAELLRSLPKSLRRQLMPLQPKVEEILRELKPAGKSLLEDLAAFLRKHYQVEVTSASWAAEALPVHLRPRIEVSGLTGGKRFSGRSVAELAKQLEETKAQPANDPPGWEKACQKWEKFALTSWSIEDAPERVDAGHGPAGPLHGWPGLQLEEQQVNLRLFRSQAEARKPGLPALQRLVELQLQKDLGWLQKDLRAVVRFEPLLKDWMTAAELQTSAYEHLRQRILPSEPLRRLTKDAFEEELRAARERLSGALARFEDQLTPILQMRHDLARKFVASQPAPRPMTSLSQLTTTRTAAAPAHPFRTELDRLVPQNFLAVTPPDRLPHLTRYLKALQVRAERAALNPVKDRERAVQLAPYVQALAQLRVGARTPEVRAAVEEFRWALEEYRISLFAQELGTAFPISPKRLDEQLANISQRPY